MIHMSYNEMRNYFIIIMAVSITMTFLNNNKLELLLNNKGFSLAEMMVVMLILSIILAASMPIITHRVVAANEEKNETVIPAGIINPFAGIKIPDGWLLCDGKMYSATGTYSDLYNAIGYTYGGSGGNFKVPDLKGRTLIGLDNLGGTSANIVTSTAAHTMGGIDGEEKHLLTISEIPSHSHTGYTDTQGVHTHLYSYAIPEVPWDGDYGIRTGGNAVHRQYNWTTTQSSGSHSHNVYTYTAGSDSLHNIMQPYMAVNYIIKY